MATSVTMNGTSYDIPAVGDSFGTALSNYLIAISTSCLQKTGGSFTLSADANVSGSGYGLVSTYYKSSGSNISTAGVVRLANGEEISWRNNANDGNISLSVNSSDQLEFNGVALVNSSLGTAYQVLATNSGATAQEWTKIDNNHIAAAAAIAVNKLAALTASRAVVSDGSGFITASAATATEVGYLTGVSSAIQTQLDAKIDDFSGTTDNVIVRTNGTGGDSIQESGVVIDDSDNISGVANITLSGDIDMSSDATLDIGGTTATTVNISRFGQTTVIKGDLRVDGTTTTVNSTTLDVADANITVNDGGNQASADGTAGITVEMSDATDTKIIYDSSAASRFAVGDSGSEAEIATISHTQTLTNKTLTSPAINTATITSATVATAMTFSNQAELRLAEQTGNGSHYVGFSAPDAVTGNQIWKLPDGDGNNGQTMVTDGSGNLSWGSAGGSSGINYVDNANFEQTTDEGSPDGWTDQDTDFAITGESSSPLRGTISGIIEATASASANDVVYYEFTLDTADANKLMRLSFDYAGDSNYTSDDISVDLLRDPGGDDETITPSVTNIPKGPGRFDATFVANGADTYRLRFTLNTGSTALALTIDDIRVTPELAVVGTPIAENLPVSYSISAGFGTTSDETIRFERIGSFLICYGQFTNGTVTGAGAYIDLDNLTIDTSNVVAGTTGQDVGNWWRLGSSSSTSFAAGQGGPIFIDPSTDNNRIYFTRTIAASVAGFSKDAVSTIAASSDKISFRFQIPIAEWSGSANFGQQRTEYASNYSSTDADDTTSFAYGPGGSVGIFGTTALTANRRKKVRFQNAIQPTDRLALQIYDGEKWIDLEAASSSGLVPLQFQNGVAYGMCIDTDSPGDTDVNVFFGRYFYPSGSTYGAAGGSWSALGAAIAKWRVVKYSQGTMGVGLATETEAGAIDFYKTESVALDNNFSSGNAVCTRIGNVVTITLDSVAGHSSSSAPETSSGLIPANYRPSDDMRTCYYTSTVAYSIIIESDGTLSTTYYASASDPASLTSRTDVGVVPTISYVIT